LRVSPHYLAFFNELAGGPGSGHRVLVDSNLDWGQDLKGLRNWMSDHGVSKSLYAKDPDGIEFEVLWRVPREHWGDMEHTAITHPLDLVAELNRWSSRNSAVPATI